MEDLRRSSSHGWDGGWNTTDISADPGWMSLRCSKGGIDREAFASFICKLLNRRQKKGVDLRRPLERTVTRTTLEYGFVDAPRLVGRFRFAARRLAIPLQGVFSMHGSYHPFVRTVS